MKPEGFKCEYCGTMWFGPAPEKHYDHRKPENRWGLKPCLGKIVSLNYDGVRRK